ncbi:MAG: 23S rRNA (adenine(2030)-N(6))-methyltransferase RlmJ [Pelagimonas sp.]|jgi:23S rRNA (adenine2030-N6)-methyltransferase|nr:23S rRNA (adenine(2030)-N(6))-methyltransferase RlmJ [Pelagimonas sp.]
MLSYQHAYHAGNLADVQKHALLAQVLAYLTRKDKPLSYIETHSGRGLYDLTGVEAQKTGEAAKGVQATQSWFAADHPYRQAVQRVRKTHGKTAYPGSPLIAQSLLRPSDSLHLAELHPQEFTALRQALRAPNTRCYHQNGFDLAQSLCPPEPRRGVMVIDPSWEVKTDYQTVPKFMASIARKWNVGILMLWYPILRDGSHKAMLTSLSNSFPDALRHEVSFPAARDGHRMIGSGMFIVNPPWGLDDFARDLSRNFARLK